MTKHLLLGNSTMAGTSFSLAKTVCAIQQLNPGEFFFSKRKMCVVAPQKMRGKGDDFAAINTEDFNIGKYFFSGIPISYSTTHF